MTSTKKQQDWFSFNFLNPFQHLLSISALYFMSLRVELRSHLFFIYVHTAYKKRLLSVRWWQTCSHSHCTLKATASSEGENITSPLFIQSMVSNGIVIYYVLTEGLIKHKMCLDIYYHDLQWMPLSFKQILKPVPTKTTRLRDKGVTIQSTSR